MILTDPIDYREPRFPKIDEEPPSELTVGMDEQHGDFFIRNAVGLRIERRWVGQHGQVLLHRGWVMVVHREALMSLTDTRAIIDDMVAVSDRTLRPWAYPDYALWPEVVISPLLKKVRRLYTRIRWRLRVWRRKIQRRLKR